MTTRAIPQSDSSNPVNTSHLLVVFDPDSTVPISQTIADILAAGTGTAGADGSSVQMLFRATASSSPPVTPTGNTPAGWSATAQPSTTNRYLWSARRTGGNPTWGAWVVALAGYYGVDGNTGPQGPVGPQGVQGATGAQGTQGNGYQVLHQRTASATEPAAPVQATIGTDWLDDAPEITAAMPYLWGADRIGYTGNWGAWNVFLVGRYGADGEDGQDGTGGGASLSDDDPEPIGTALDDGTGTEASKVDHVHTLSDGIVTTARLADDAVDSDKLGNNAVQTDNLNNLAVTEVKLHADVTAKLAAAWANNGSVLVAGTDISVTLNTAGNYVIAYTGTGTTPSTHQRYGAYQEYTGSPTAFTESDFTGGVSSTSESITLSGATDASNRLFAVAFWSAEQLTFITSGNTVPTGQNIISDFGTFTRLTINSVNGYVYTDSGLLSAEQINTEWTVR